MPYHPIAQAHSPPVHKHWDMPLPWPECPSSQRARSCWGRALFSSSDAVSRGLSPRQPEHPNTHAAQDRSPPSPERQRQAGGAPRGRRQRDTSGGVQRVSFCVSRCMGCWLVPTSWCLWAQHSSGAVQSGKKPRSEPGLPAAPTEAEAVGAGTTLQPAAGQEAPQGRAGAQVATASKVEALSAWPAPWAPGHLEADTGQGISVAQPEAPGFPGYLPRLP